MARVDIEALLAILAMGAASGVIGGWLGIAVSRRLGLLGVDVFKPWRRERVPEAAGFGLALLVSLGLLLLPLLTRGSPLVYLSASMLTLFNALIGLVDDLRRMDPVTKPLLTMASAAIPMVVSGCIMDWRVYVPLYGWARLTIIYPLLLPIFIGVSANAFNMIDVVNGSMPTAFLASSIAVAIGYTLMSSMLGVEVHEAIPVIAYSAAAVLAYLIAYNRYPARAFNGDSGSLALGALAVYQAILAKQELVYLVAITPLILNSFQILSTVRGFVERRNIPRPTRIDEKGLVHATCNPRSPPTVVQLLTAGEPLDEKSIYVSLLLVYTASAALAILAALLIYTMPVVHH